MKRNKNKKKTKNKLTFSLHLPIKVFKQKTNKQTKNTSSLLSKILMMFSLPFLYTYPLKIFLHSTNKHSNCDMFYSWFVITVLMWCQFLLFAIYFLSFFYSIFFSFAYFSYSSLFSSALFSFSALLILSFLSSFPFVPLPSYSFWCSFISS